MRTITWLLTHLAPFILGSVVGFASAKSETADCIVSHSGRLDVQGNCTYQAGSQRISYGETGFRSDPEASHLPSNSKYRILVVGNGFVSGEENQLSVAKALGIEFQNSAGLLVSVWNGGRKTLNLLLDSEVLVAEARRQKVGLILVLLTGASFLLQQKIVENADSCDGWSTLQAAFLPASVWGKSVVSATRKGLAELTSQASQQEAIPVLNLYIGGDLSSEVFFRHPQSCSFLEKYRLFRDSTLSVPDLLASLSQRGVATISAPVRLPKPMDTPAEMRRLAQQLVPWILPRLN